MNFLKKSRLLSLLLAGLFASITYADGDEGGGDGAAIAAAAEAAALARGDTLGDAAPNEAEEAAAAAKAAGLTDPLAKENDELTDEEKAAAAAAGKTDEEGEVGADGKRKDTRIPLARHEQILNRTRAERDALAAQVAQYQKGTVVADTNKVIAETETQLLALEGEYNKLLVDGEVEKATTKMREIRQLERSINEQKNTLVSAAAEARAIERVRYDTTVERIEAAYPIMNPDHEDFDQAKVAEVIELKTAFQAQGATPAAALQKAVKYVLGAETTKEKGAVEVKAKVETKDVAAERKAAALKKNVDAAAKTPANLAAAGLNSDELGGTLTAERAMKMSQKDFAALDEKSLAKLRGDEL